MHPHKVLDRILQDNFPSSEILHKPDSHFRGRSKLMTLLFSLFWNVRMWILLLFSRSGARLIMREFDTFSVVYLALPRRVNLLLNVNHNLGTLHGRIVTRLLAWRFTVIFLDGGEHIREQFPHISTVSSGVKPKAYKPITVNPKEFILLCGNNPDQACLANSEIDLLREFLQTLGYKAKLIGRNHPEGIFVDSDELYLQMVEDNPSIVLTYFNNRHAGTIWYMTENSPIFYFQNSPVFVQQAKLHPNAVAYKDVSDLLSILESKWSGEQNSKII